MSEGQVILYQTDDGSAHFRLNKLDGTVWMNQIEIAELYHTSKQAISHHIRNILAEGEVTAEATVKDSLTVQTERRLASRTISFNERSLNRNGRINHDAMKRIAHDRCDALGRQQKQQDAIAAADLLELETVEAEVLTRKGSGR